LRILVAISKIIKTIIPASGASISPDDISSVVESALQGWFTDFKFCEKFRQEANQHNKEL
ncbi:unnamed protein product, partial [marine sediment metagenome]